MKGRIKNKMVTKEELSYFKEERTSDELFKRFGFKSGTNILKEVIEEGFVKPENKKLSLTESGKNKLNELKDAEKKEKKDSWLKNPLMAIILSVILTAAFTFLITSHFMDVENELSVRFIGENKIITPPNETIAFNGITIYNPTSKKVGIGNVYVERTADWIKYQPDKIINKNVQTQEEISYSIPEIVNDYEPYMVLESGETKLMSGQFSLNVPSKEGLYELNFYIETLDGERYYVDRKMIVEVVQK